MSTGKTRRQITRGIDPLLLVLYVCGVRGWKFDEVDKIDGWRRAGGG